MRPMAVALLASIVAGGCTQRAELTRRYVGVYPNAPSCHQQPLARLTAFARAIPDPDPDPLVLKLGADGQAALVKALAKHAGDSTDTLFDSLGREAESAEVPDAVDRTAVKVRVILSVSRSDFNRAPADRFEGLIITLGPLQNGRIKNWDRFTTQYGTVDLGQMDLTRKDEFSAKADLVNLEKVTVGSEVTLATPQSVGLAYTGGRELAESVALKQRHVILSGALLEQGRSAELYQQGVVGIDLVGEAAVDLTIKVDPDDTKRVVKFLNLFGDAGANTAEKVRLAQQDLLVPSAKAASDGIKATIGGKYRMRHVTSGDSTIIEGDDTVQYAEGSFLVPTGSNPITLVSAGALESRRTFWRLVRPTTDAAEVILTIAQPFGRPAQFASRADALAVLAWMRARIAKGDRTDQPVVLGEGRYGLLLEYDPTTLEQQPFTLSQAASLEAREEGYLPPK